MPFGFKLAWAKGTMYTVLWWFTSTVGRAIFPRRLYIVKYRDSAVICAKTAEPIEMPFGLWDRMGPGNHVLDMDPDHP